MSGLFVGDGTSDGDELALLDLLFESHSLFDRRIRATIAAAAACGGGHHGLVGSGGYATYA